MYFLRIFLTLKVLVLLSAVSSAAAQVNFTAPATATKIAACDEFATQVLLDPWDMNNTADINNFVPTDIGGLSNPTWGSSQFSFVTSAANAAFFYLFSPEIGGAMRAGGRWGQDLTVNTSKYRILSVRMYTDTLDSGGMRLIWNRSQGYTSDRTVTGFLATGTGWRTYRYDLINDVTVSAGESSNANGWASGSISGFALQPHQQSGATVAIDDIRLEDPTTCGSTTVTGTSASVDNEQFVNLYLDGDQDPFNGYFSKLQTAGSAGGNFSVSASALGLAPGTYSVLSLITSDFASLYRDDPWDMSESSDILVTTEISAGSVSGGAYSGTTSGAGSSIYVRLPSTNIDTSVFSKLSFKLTRSSGGQLAVFWDGGGGIGVDPAMHDADGDSVYQVDLSSEPSWTGNVTQLIIRPATTSGVSFALDFVSLRSSGYVTSLATASELVAAGKIDTSAGSVVVNAPPLVNFSRPGKWGGEAIRPWNMNDGDFQLFSNLRTDADPSQSGETYSAFLPDVRTVSSLRGDFFKGTNELGNDDPNNFSTFPQFSSTPLEISAADYHNLCFKLMIDRDFDLCLGSVARVLWKDSSFNVYTSDDIVAIYDRWGNTRWYEYCVDMASMRQENGATDGWAGTVTSFRVDPHEFSKDTCGADGTPTGGSTSTTYYFDYIKLRKDNVADTGAYTIVYQLSDADDSATMSLYYTQSASAQGGTEIATGLTESSGSVVWDTSGLTSGTYYVYAVATDGVNSVSSLAPGSVKITNTGASAGSAPVLSIESPIANQTYCSTMQVKGFALEPLRYEEVSSVEVFIDGAYVASLRPSLYSPQAVANYPNQDASNSGFDSTLDITGLSDGAHSVVIKAISRTGLTTTSDAVSVTKANSGCAPAVSDAAPAGSPIAVTEVGAPETAAPSIASATLSKRGVLSLSIENATDDLTQCTLYVKAGTSRGELANVKALSPTASTVSLMVKKLRINKKVLPKFFLSVAKEGCSNGFARAESNPIAITVTTKGKIKTTKALRKALGRLKVQ